MANEHVASPLSIRIIRRNTKLLLELQSAANVELTEIQISPVFVQGYNDVNENIMVKFDVVPKLAPGERCVVRHQTYFPKAHPSGSDDLWEESDDFYDFLMCLTPKLSRDVPYELDISFSVIGESDHQTIAAGAGSNLEPIVP